MTNINISENALREVLKDVFRSGYNGLMEEKDDVVEQVLTSLKEKEAARVEAAQAPQPQQPKAKKERS